MSLGENEEDYFSNSSSSSGSEDRNAEKLTSKEFKIVKITIQRIILLKNEKYLRVNLFALNTECQ